jgi:hypothetical protein
VKINPLQLLLLGGLGLAGFFVYQKLGKQAAVREIAQDAHALTQDAPTVTQTYEQASQAHAEALVPTIAPDGSRLFQPLDQNPANPLVAKGYVAVVKDLQRSQQNLYDENHVYLPTVTTYNQYAQQRVARIFFYNPSTGREVAAWELKKNADLWVPDMQRAVEATFANAFNYACKVNTSYDQWANVLRVDTRGVYQRYDCDLTYPVNM